MSQKVIFCDFDGTVTKGDNIVSLMDRFAPKEWEDIKDAVLARTLSIREGVGRMFRLLPSSSKDDLLRYLLETTEIRPGFKEFVAYTKREGLALYIVSGGIDFFVYPLLEPFDIPPENIFCNGSDFSGERIEITWPYACGEECGNDCGCCKPGIMNRFDSSGVEKIVIGDSVTDLQAAKKAHTVFARDYLLNVSKNFGIEATPFENFYDIINEFERRKEGEENDSERAVGRAR